jgi:type IV pilus assembly protein PilY1
MKYFVKNYLNRTGWGSAAFLLPTLSTISSFGYSKWWAKQPAHPTFHPLNQKQTQQHLVVHTEPVKRLNRGLSMSKQTATAKFSLILLGISLSLFSGASQAGTVAQAPLFLSSTVKPNIMLMLDNSFSMTDQLKSSAGPYDPALPYDTACKLNPAFPSETVVTSAPKTGPTPVTSPADVTTYKGLPPTSSSCPNTTTQTWNSSNGGTCTLIATSPSSTTSPETTRTSGASTIKERVTTTVTTVTTTTKSRVVGTSPAPLNNSANCTGAGGSWSSNKCTIAKIVVSVKKSSSTVTDTVTTTPIVYNTNYANAPKTVPDGFSGKIVNKVAGTACFSRTLAYTTSGIAFPSDVVGNDQRANYLNWFYTNELAKSVVLGSRMDNAKTAAKSWIAGLKNDVRVGFSTFNSDDGGYLWEEVDDLTATKKTSITNRINATTANASTPLAETMVDIGRYFATAPTATDTKKVTLRAGESDASSKPRDNIAGTPITPGVLPSNLANVTAATKAAIQYRCQKSYAVVITDGLPSADRDISTNAFLRDYDGDCTGKDKDGRENIKDCGKCKTTNGSDCNIATDSKWNLNADNTPNTSDDFYDMKRLFNYPFQCNNSTTAACVVGGSGSDNSSDYFDDVTKALFEMDLRPDLRNIDKEGSQGKNNLTTYVVGFADDAINPNVPGVNPLPENAAIKGGGKFFFAANVNDLTSSLTRTFQFISAQESASSSVAANSTQFQTNALLFQALFNSADWSGNIKTFNLESEDTNGNGKLDSKNDTPKLVDIDEDINGNGVLDTGKINFDARWEAKDRIPEPIDRNIVTFNPVTAKGINFQWLNLNAAQKDVLNNLKPLNTSFVNEGEKVLAYLRGDQSNEGTGDTEYRERSIVLGDIINSDPLFVGKQDLGYSTLPEGSLPTGQGYAAHVALKDANTEMLYVGANDGMLHAFQVDANLPLVEQGKELFAYVPNAAISPELVTLATDRNYVHKYFVDGAPQYGDAYFDNNWHTVLVGSMGGGSTTEVGGVNGTGGRAVFGLDITNPNSFGINNVLWEFSNRDDADLGYTIPTPSVVRMADGSWAAIVANGYNSANGKAALFILDIKTGKPIGGKALVAGVSGGNGLSTPTPVDVDGDKIVDYIYAGDLKGNMWKFDVTGTTPTKWGVANGGKPLYIACTVDANDATPCAAADLQPITSKPSVVEAKAKDQKNGVMVLFGTGKYYEDGDHQVSATPQIQSFYAIWDICDKKNAATCTSGAVSGRSQLLQQKILDDGPDFRFTSACQVAYGTVAPSPVISGCDSLTSRKGWYIDLKSPSAGGQGERAVSPPVVRENSVLFTTIIPINITCEPDGTGYVLDMDINGARFAAPSIDINGDGKVDKEDLQNGMTVTGIKSKDGIIKTPTIVGGGIGALENMYFNTTSSKIMNFKRCPPGGCSTPPPTCLTDPTLCPPPPVTGGSRRSWRQLF